MRLLARGPLPVLLLTAASLAHADAQSAADAYFRNLEKWHYDVAAQATVVARDDTLVQGIYRLENRASGRFIAMITERGDLKGDSNGWVIVGSEGPISLTAEQRLLFRAEVMRNIRLDQLVPVRYGDGGGRSLILISAVNCPYCRLLEENLARVAGSLRTTFYVLPGSLTPLALGDEGRRTWQQAANLGCSNDGGESWRAFWTTHATPTPSPGTCTPDAAAAERRFRNFGTVLASIGAFVKGTPALILEDGSASGVPAAFDADHAERFFGPAGRPQESGVSLHEARWLTPVR
jgi:hypothetical protein